LIGIDRGRLEEASCECYRIMRLETDRIFSDEAVTPRLPFSLGATLKVDDRSESSVFLLVAARVFVCRDRHALTRLRRPRFLHPPPATSERTPARREPLASAANGQFRASLNVRGEIVVSNAAMPTPKSIPSALAR
jgi:hypothetical protein